MPKKTIPYYQSLKFLRSIFPANTVLYLDLLLDKHKFWSENNSLYCSYTGRDFDGTFYISRSEISEEIGIMKGAQYSAEKRLQDEGIIRMRAERGNANWYLINFKKINQLFKQYTKSKELKNDNKKESPFSADEIKEFGAPKLETWDDSLQTPTPPETVRPPIQKSEVNNNKEIKTNNKNKVSKETHFSTPENTETSLNQTESTSSGRSEQRELVPPPQGDDPTDGSFEEVMELVNCYNSIMGFETDDTDISYASNAENLTLLRKIKPLLNKRVLDYSWDVLLDKNGRDMIDTKRIAAFFKFGVAKLMLRKKVILQEYQRQTIDNELDLFFQMMAGKAKLVFRELGYTLDGLGRIEPISNINSSTKEERNIRYKVYCENFNKWNDQLPSSQQRDMIEMEV